MSMNTVGAPRGAPRSRFLPRVPERVRSTLRPGGCGGYHDGTRKGCLSPLDRATQFGHLDAVMWLHANYAEGFSGQLKVLRWLHRHGSVGCTSDAMVGAAAYNKLKVVMWLHRHGRREDAHESILKAAEYGHVRVVAWLYLNGSQEHALQAMLAEAGNGQLGVVNWLYVNARELLIVDYFNNLYAAIHLAVGGGHTLVVLWLLNESQTSRQSRRHKRRHSDSNKVRGFQMLPVHCDHSSFVAPPSSAMAECEAVAAAAVEAAGNPPVIKNLPEMRVVTLRAVIANYRAQRTLWDQVLTFSRAQGLAIAGPCFTIYYDQGYKEKDVDAEVCLPIAMDAQVNEGAASKTPISVRTLPVVAKAAALVHLGSYDDLNPSYQKLYEWIGKEGLHPNSPVREVYIRMNIEDTSEKSFVTEVQQPVA